MSKQRQIIDALITPLEAITGVNLVTEDLAVWNNGDPNSYNMLLISPSKPEVERFAFIHPTSEDMHGVLEITIEGTTYSQYASDTKTVLDALMVSVEKAIVGSATLNALVIDIMLQNDEYVFDISDNYGLFSAVYTVEYLYNHLAP